MAHRPDHLAPSGAAPALARPSHASRLRAGVARSAGRPVRVGSVRTAGEMGRVGADPRRARCRSCLASDFVRSLLSAPDRWPRPVRSSARVPLSAHSDGSAGTRSARTCGNASPDPGRAVGGSAGCFRRRLLRHRRLAAWSGPRTAPSGAAAGTRHPRGRGGLVSHQQRVRPRMQRPVVTSRY